ncbi:hypothetical protein [Legionella sp.]|uniref:hypothetical protein n=1 Tax=Legionella sp. TaxID=459 RepID=UPI003CB1A806
MKNHMNKLVKISLVCLISSNIYANDYSSDAKVKNIMAKINNDMRNDRIKEGFSPNGGVTIVPSSQVNAPEKLKKQWMNERREQENKGYISVYSERAKELMQLKDIVHFKYDSSLNNKDKNSSIFRRNIDEIALAYNFLPIDEKYISKVYGFAASNTFKEGWTGVVEFFESADFGACAYTESNVTLTHQAAKVDENIVRYDVNNKITTFNVEGNSESGFLYQIDWFDNNFFRTLECAYKDYSSKNSNSLIALAQEIDKN